MLQTTGLINNNASIANKTDFTETLSTPEAKKSGSCPSTGDKPQLDASIQERIAKHPCYSEDAHHHYARMHVAVAPACNIQCNYCNRKYD